ncbi:hypothetical protein PIB30_033305 [Stylosanthes scabra]|uniref:TIR domain-containing protein n=1 Tax=Stylosanthes scabra TaxID=79078 RepID=A0ABU6TC68_9FABA|nr:hypothetical protein [Stylosanthes scabra]
MASASSSTSVPPRPQPPRSSYTYHVFLSFRGEDTRTGFTSHLHAALNRKGITSYRDDKNLRKGDVISDELVKAIEESMFAVIVFSPDYASSSWCLDELCKILDCKNKLGLQMVEVFYGVEPSDVRHHFRKLSRSTNRDMRVKRLAKKFSFCEAVLVENIAQHIFETLIPKLPSSMKNLVGIQSRVEQVISQIGLGLNDVRYIGMWGMGGIGKTTIAREVYETIRSRFEVTCFLVDVRDQCEKKDIVHVQKQLLDQMHIGSTTVFSEYDGRTIIQNSLRLKKVLLVLDDVNDENQLENLAGEQDWFGPGSRIIVTTRDIHLLKEQEVCEIYEVEGLVKAEAFNFFCLKAFKHPEPMEGFSDLSEEVLKYNGGLPLALKVLGSHLFGRSIEMKTVGWGCMICLKKWANLLSLKNLQMMLVSVADCGVNKDFDSVVTQKKEFEATYGIVLHSEDLEIEENWSDYLDRRAFSFSNICPLKLLIFDDVRVPFCVIFLFLNKLEHLDLSYCHYLKQTPDLSGAPNLKTLYLRRCRKLDYIHPSLAHHKSLVELNLCRCSSLETLGDKLEMSSLEKLNLKYCKSLRRLPEFGECMKQL